ncbi:hypothetical protein AB4Z01_02225 [Inquilinus sp. YAF38]
MVSQVLTPYTIRVLYLALDRFRLWPRQRWARALQCLAGPALSAVQ